MQKERDANQSLQKYMQGSTNVYIVNNVENCDDGYGCVLKTYIPEETEAINHVYLSYDVSSYRTYSSITEKESAHTHGIPSLTVNSATVNATTTVADTTNSKTPDASGVVSVWASLPFQKVGLPNRHSVTWVDDNGYLGSSTLYTTRGLVLVYNGTGSGQTVDASITFPSGGFDSSGDYYLPNGAVYKHNGGESSSSNASGWARFDDENRVATSWSGTLENIYSHSHGSHRHDINELTVNGTTTQTTTTTSSTSDAGSEHNHGVIYGISTGSNTVTDMQIFIDGTDRTASIETQIGHTLSTTGTENEIDISQWIGTVGTWHTIEIKPNGTCRIRGDLWNQIFIRSE